MSLSWYTGLLHKGGFRIWGTAIGVMVSVALLVSLAAFLTHSSATMTERATAAVPIDWQVELIPSADPAKIAADIRMAAKVTALQQVEYADTAGFQAKTGGTVQTTGPGKAIAWDSSYLKDFPKESRPLVGASSGALLAQQTAANLHARPGDVITVDRVGLPPVDLKIDGVVDLPDADALFQAVGLPKTAQPQAPPDNVLILPPAEWHRIFDQQTAAHAGSTRIQFHVHIDHASLPSAPTAAYNTVTGETHNLEARVAGNALVSDNLGARLGAVREDALYATVLFLFLGVPGIFLAALLTMSATAANAAQRRVEQALLRVRGASMQRILGLAAGEALLTGAIGIVVGAGLTIAAAWFIGAGLPGVAAVLAAIILGFALALASILVPAWLAGRHVSAAQSRRSVERVRPMPWERFYPDLILIALSGLLFWLSASGGYQIVLAPEGVAATAVDYKAFIAPALLWAGSALLALRLARLALRSRHGFIIWLVRPIAGILTPVVSSTMARQSPRIALATAVLALAVAFAVSTAIFNTTYNAQAHVDAELTNGSDVTVFGTTADPAGAHLEELSALPDAAAAVPMQHRYAYVGSDLQDIYGIHTDTIGNATNLSNAYFTGLSASEALHRLQNTPDGVLVSAETVNDFQLKIGDHINLRLMDAKDHQYHAVPFTFIGIVREFPTAPKDSFLVANAAHLAKTTHDPAAEYVLMRATGKPSALASEVTNLLQGLPGLKVKDIASVTHIIGSSLTAVDLRGLTRIELAFAVALTAAASGLLLLLGFFERRRSFAILDALGARPWQMASFIWSEGVLVLAGGVVMGAAVGIAIAWMLVKLLTGVFDPPPEALAWPVGYLALLFAMVLAATWGALWIAARASVRSSPQLLRDTLGAA